MKNIFLLVLLLTGCASNSSSTSAKSCAGSALLGTWSVTGPTDSLTFNEDCTGIKLGCEVVFSYSNTTSTTGSQSLTITSYNSDPGCAGYDPSNGTLDFTYGISGNDLTTTFPNGASIVWTK